MMHSNNKVQRIRTRGHGVLPVRRERHAEWHSNPKRQLDVLHDDSHPERDRELQHSGEQSRRQAVNPVRF